MKQCIGSYVLEFQSEPSRFRKGTRYHWMVSLAQKPDELVSWGYALTLQLAEIAARSEVEDLESGLTQGGRCGAPRSAKSVADLVSRECLLR
jgi:hypothetical protein